MAVKLVFLGRLADVAGVAERSMALEDSSNGTMALGALLAELPVALGEMLQRSKVKMAHNGVLLARGSDVILVDGDELAFLPPVSGG